MKLDWLTQRIDQAPDVEAALHDSTTDLCKALNADRITIYKATPDGAALSAIVQSGLEEFGALKVRVGSNSSFAGHVGATRKLVNIANAYDETELEPLQLQKKMFVAVDQRTGYRTRQVLAAPVLSQGKLVGVVEVINSLEKKRFSAAAEEDVMALCEAIAAALAK